MEGRGEEGGEREREREREVIQKAHKYTLSSNNTFTGESLTQ